MGFFSKKYNEIEESLLELYTEMFTSMGLPGAKKRAQEMLNNCIDESKKTGNYDLPLNIGDMLTGKIQVDEEYKAGIEGIRVALDKSRKEGAIDDDICWWYNLNDIEKRMMIGVDDMNRSVLFISKLQEGLSPDDASEMVRKYHPTYGDPDDTTHASGDDRPLPVELKNRINIYIENRTLTDHEEYEKDIENTSSFNALIRKEMIKGNV